MKALASIMTSITALSIFMGNALAAQPIDAGLWHQPAASKKMEDIIWFDVSGSSHRLPFSYCCCFFG